METIPSFAPLAERLAANAAGLRAVDGSRDALSEFAALVMCALLDMLICLCEAMDARAAMDVHPVTAVVLPIKAAAGVPVHTLAGKRRARSPGLARKVRVLTPIQADPQSVTAGVTTAGFVGQGSRDPGPLRAIPTQLRRPVRKNAPFRPPSSHAHFVALS